MTYYWVKGEQDTLKWTGQGGGYSGGSLTPQPLLDYVTTPVSNSINYLFNPGAFRDFATGGANFLGVSTTEEGNIDLGGTVARMTGMATGGGIIGIATALAVIYLGYKVVKKL